MMGFSERISVLGTKAAQASFYILHTITVRIIQVYVWIFTTEDNDSTDKNDANTCSWHIGNVFFLDNKYFREAIQVNSSEILKTLICG